MDFINVQLSYNQTETKEYARNRMEKITEVYLFERKHWKIVFDNIIWVCLIQYPTPKLIEYAHNGLMPVKQYPGVEMIASCACFICHLFLCVISALSFS